MPDTTLRTNPLLSRGLQCAAASIVAVASNLVLYMHWVASLLAQAFGESIPANPSDRARLIAALAIAAVTTLVAIVSTSPGRLADRAAMYLLALCVPGAMVLVAILGTGVLIAEL